MTEVAAPTAPTSHYRYAPSSCSRWVLCPGSALPIDEMPEVENMYGGREEGSVEHTLAAEILLGAKGVDEALPYPGVLAYVQHVWGNNLTAAPIVERQFVSIEVPDHGGTLDCLLLQDNKAVIYDYKSGKWPVKAADNPQLLCYAGIIAEHFDITQFWGVIVQPNSKAKDKITVARYPLEQVQEHREKVQAAASSDQLNAGQHCLFCPLLQAKVCGVGRDHAKTKGWIGRYKHLAN